MQEWEVVNVESTDIELWDLVHKVNLDSVFLGYNAIPLMRDSGNSSQQYFFNVRNCISQTSAYILQGCSKTSFKINSTMRKVYKPYKCSSLHPVFTRTTWCKA